MIHDLFAQSSIYCTSTLTQTLLRIVANKDITKKLR